MSSHKVVPISIRRPEDEAYARMMTEGRSIYPSKATTKEQFFAEQMEKWNRGELKRKPIWEQPASTQRVLSMTSKELAEYHNRPWPPSGWKANEEIWKELEREDLTAKQREELISKLVGERKVPPEEMALIHATRQRSKNTAGDASSEGGGNSVDDWRRAKAIESFTCFPPVEMTPELFKSIVNMVKIQSSAPLIEEPKKKSLYERIKERFAHRDSGTSEERAPFAHYILGKGKKDE